MNFRSINHTYGQIHTRSLNILKTKMATCHPYIFKLMRAAYFARKKTCVDL